MVSDKRIATKFVVVVVVLLFCAFVSGDVEVRCMESEREALLSLKNGFIDEDGALSSWQSDECCEWYGVVCSNTTRHVISLYVGHIRLRGKIGSSLLELHHLKYLELSLNDFGGIPIPEFIGSMKQLQHLDLRESNFSGIVPPELGNLTNLRSLDLSFNSLRTENLDWLSRLSLLSILDLSQMDLSHTNCLQQIRSLKFLRELYLAFCNIIAVKLSVDSSSTSLSILGSVLKSIEILVLHRNQLNGSIPDFRAFSSLRILSLSGNNFTGSIPLSIGQFSNLEFLDLSNNSLGGLVSESHFIKLDKLNTLDLSLNSLILDISPDWSPPFQLTRLHLARCNVGIYFPKWIRTQTNLTYLDLDGANIKDEAPRWLWSSFSQLKGLSLTDNQISGTIPNLSSTIISFIDLSYNKFSGAIPLLPANVFEIRLSGNMFSGSISSICKTHYSQLDSLFLSNNQLEGEVPDCWEKMSGLVTLNLANNSFSGEIPASLGNLHSLAVLQMHGNNLSSALPYNLRHCQQLILIDVGGNKLTGEIPTWIGQLYNMHFLNLRGNKLHGGIPAEICNLTYIQVLDLSINNLSSIIPDCFGNFTVLASKNTTNYFEPLLFVPISPFSAALNKHYGYSSFEWKGGEFYYWDNLGLLKLVDFSSNRLTGNIPQSFSNMRGLKSLNLSRNGLTGNIIPDIGKMEMLDSLDLSHNQLSGNIPTSLAEIYTLGFLDLSTNKLSGKIPTSTQLQSFDASSYAGNDGLYGDPLPKCPEDRLRPSTTNPVENMKEKDNNNFSFMEEVGISMAFGFIFGFWGVVGSFVMKKSWRIAFFNSLDAAGDWFYVRIVVFVSKWRQS